MLDQEGKTLFGCRTKISLALYVFVKGLQPEYFVDNVASDNFSIQKFSTYGSFSASET